MYTVIVANGTAPQPEPAQRWLKDASVILAADGGSTHCLALGYVPDILIGDLDSVDKDTLRAVTEGGGQVLEYPHRKNANDLELALDHTLQQNPSQEVIVLGAVGGRWDQTITNWLLLAHPKYRALDIRMVDASQSARLAQPARPLSLHGQIGDTVSLVPLAGDAVAVTTRGLEYPLTGETLQFASSRGVSNRMIEPEAHVSLEGGLLLCLHLEASILEEED